MVVNCTLSTSEAPPTPQPPQPEATSQKPYERKFSFLQRIFKVLVSPREGMEDVALAPSYGEVFGILAIQMFASLVIIALVFSKIQFVGVPPAASITGYTYLVNILLSIISMIVSWHFIPLIVIDVKNLELTQQLNWLWLCLLPAFLLGIAWKSYLGGLGANFGTGGKCPQKLGFTVFFYIGLVGLLISVISNILR